MARCPCCGRGETLAEANRRAVATILGAFGKHYPLRYLSGIVKLRLDLRFKELDLIRPPSLPTVREHIRAIRGEVNETSTAKLSTSTISSGYGVSALAYDGTRFSTSAST
jgi:hypothetical protein